MPTFHADAQACSNLASAEPALKLKAKQFLDLSSRMDTHSAVLFSVVSRR
jgi:hypothetical protein